jgi:hypothetical protein
MVKSIFWSIEYHPRPDPAHDFTNLFTLFRGIAMGGTFLASSLILPILAMI